MIKKSINLSQRFIIWLASHPWLKLIALIAAVLVWFYVRGEINNGGIKYK